MTVYEHLEFYARIKGIPSNKRDSIIRKQIKDMNLDDFVNIRAETLSGGNKRKLSVAMAMIGNPPIVFLDEPSTGMDPQAKRFMWSVISKISTQRKQSTVILTTHSMEEAEALCTKMGIMVQGQFKCYGSCQHIKDKFGTGYEIEVKIRSLTDGQVQDIASQIQRNPQEKIDMDGTTKVLDQLQSGFLKEEITYEGFGQEIYNDLFKQGSISLQTLIKWTQVESIGTELFQELTERFGEVEILEHYNTFFKFRVSRGDKSIGYLFGFMESIVSIN